MANPFALFLLTTAHKLDDTTPAGHRWMTVLIFRAPDPLGWKGQCLEFSALMANGLIRIYGREHLQFITFSCYRRFLLPGTPKSA